MNDPFDLPFFEIGPKNLLRRAELESIARSAGRAGADEGVTVVITAPAPLVAPLHDLRAGVLVFGQGLDVDAPRDAMGAVTAAALADAGAAGVMLNHHSAQLEPDRLRAAIEECRGHGLLTIVCADTEEDALDFASMAPTVLLYEPPALIGQEGSADRPWIAPVSDRLHRLDPPVRAMHAGGVSSPSVARAIMAAGADGTGSTSGVLLAADSNAAAHSYIAAVRAGRDAAADRTVEEDRITHGEGEGR